MPIEWLIGFPSRFLFSIFPCHAQSAEKDLLSLIFGTHVMNLRRVATLNGFLRMQTDAYFSIFNDLTTIIQPLFLSFLNYAQLLQNATLT